MPKNQAAPITQDAAIQEMNRLLFEAPIAELAESQGISIDEAVKLRVEKSIEAAPLPIEVTVRPIEPMGSLRGYASVNIGGIVVDDFKVVDGKNGMFLSPPSKESNRTRSGYRATTRVTSRALQERLDALTVDAYNAAVEQLVARAEALRPAPIRLYVKVPRVPQVLVAKAEALRPAPIREQLAQAAQAADKANAERPAPDKGKETRDDR